MDPAQPQTQLPAQPAATPTPPAPAQPTPPIPMPTIQPTQQPLGASQGDPNDMSRRKKKSSLAAGNIILLAVIALGLLGAVALFSTGTISLSGMHIPFISKNATDVIATVGEEKIYRKDLDTAVSAQAVRDSKDLRTMLMQKLIDDSVALQEAQKEGLVKLDDSIYNSPNKSMTKRLAVVQEISDKIEKKAHPLSGEVVTLYFFNVNYVGPLGMTKSKELAQSKLKTLHDQVVAGKMTMKQAGDAVKNDPNNEQLDKYYVKNAYGTFTISDNEKMSADDTYNSYINTLKSGQVSDVTVVKDWQSDSKGKSVLMDSYYQFVKVTDAASGFGSYKEWLESVKKNYSISSSI